jgi:catechol 2,3-dioxygenase-like lactoylglutathione lyase family enzyme
VLFYREALGLPMKFQSPGWTEFATEGAILALHSSPESKSDEPAPDHAPAGRCQPGFQVPNLQEFHKKMLEKNVPCRQEPREVFGARIARYVDPDGLVFSVGEARS